MSGISGLGLHWDRSTVADLQVLYVVLRQHDLHGRENDHGHDGGDDDVLLHRMLRIDQYRGFSYLQLTGDALPVALPDEIPASLSSFFTPPTCKGLEAAPAAWMQACGRSLSTASKFSLAPFGEPGRVKMSVCFLTPATGRAINATIHVSMLQSLRIA